MSRRPGIEKIPPASHKVSVTSLKLLIQQIHPHERAERGSGMKFTPTKYKSSQVNTLPKAKSKTRSKQNKDMHKFSSVYSERLVPLPVSTSGGE
jgi:hypothetical protein